MGAYLNGRKAFNLNGHVAMIASASCLASGYYTILVALKSTAPVILTRSLPSVRCSVMGLQSFLVMPWRFAFVHTGGAEYYGVENDAAAVSVLGRMLPNVSIGRAKDSMTFHREVAQQLIRTRP